MTLNPVAVRHAFAAHVGLPESDIFDADLTLEEILHRAPDMRNSIDLMEAFARTAQTIRKATGRRVRLPTFPLDTRILVILDTLIASAKDAPENAEVSR